MGAGPALATEEPLPEPPPIALTEVADIAPPVIPVPEIPIPELVEPPVVVTHVDAENIDVSIRVLSPGEDAPLAQEGETAVVSPVSEPDITSSTQGIEPAAPASTEPSGVNTNVSIRVLSPGDRGEVTQADDGSGEEVVEAGVVPAAPRADAAPASSGPSSAPQYQEDNSQYQSADDSWNWRWNLILDCLGNVASSSAETGKPESLVWAWDWVWEWGCEDASRVAPTGTSASQSPPTAAESPPSRTPSSADPGVAPVEPWSWTWTFTFCGETSTITTSAGAGTPLVWAWDWSWTWACGSATEAGAPAPPPATVVVPQPQPSEDAEEDSSGLLQVVDDAAAELVPAVWFPTFPMSGNRETATTFAWPSMPEAPLELSVEVVIPPAILAVPAAPPLTSPVAPFPASGVPAEPTLAPTPASTAIPHSLSGAPTPGSLGHLQPVARTHTTHARVRTHHARPAKHAHAGSRSADRSSTPFLPLERRQPRQAAGTSNAGGFVPSALLLGVAALTGFTLLAAPGLGRRIQVARELSPRGLAHSPPDRPG
jgi:hypothetical protein